MPVLAAPGAPRAPRRPLKALLFAVALMLALSLVLALVQTGTWGSLRAAAYGRWRDLRRAQVEAALAAGRAGAPGEAGSGPLLVALRTANVTVWHRADDRDAGRATAFVAEDLYHDVAALLEPGAAARWGGVTLVLHDDPRALARAVRAGAALHAAGVYHAGVIHAVSPRYYAPDASVPGLVAAMRAEGPLAHELAHWLLDYQTRGAAPRWWSEGVAQWVERELTGFALANPFPDGARPYSTRAMALAFSRLPDQAAAYAQALGMVEAAVARGGPESLARVHQRLGDGVPFGRAVHDALGVPVEALYDAWREAQGPRPDAAGTD